MLKFVSCLGRYYAEQHIAPEALWLAAYEAVWRFHSHQHHKIDGTWCLKWWEYIESAAKAIIFMCVYAHLDVHSFLNGKNSGELGIKYQELCQQGPKKQKNPEEHDLLHISMIIFCDFLQNKIRSKHKS